MTYHQTLWGNEDLAAGAPGAGASRRRRRPRGPPRRPRRRERAFLAAAEALFGDGEATTRKQRYADAMARALRARSRRPRSRVVLCAGAAGHDVAQPHRLRRTRTRGTARRWRAARPRRASARFSARCCRSHPEHPGRPALPAAQLRRPRACAVWASTPRAPTRRWRPSRATPSTCRRTSSCSSGMWADAEASDRAAFAASEAWVEAQGPAAGHAQLPRAGLAPVRAAAAGAIPRGRARSSTRSRRWSRPPAT